MVKTVLKIALVVLIVLVVGLAAVWLMIDSLAKIATEKGVGYATGVRTTVDSVRVDLLGGGLVMQRLNLDNPEGFESPFLMRSGKFDLSMDLGSLFSDTIHLRHFELDGLTLNIEQKLGGSNVSVVVDNLKKLPSDKPAEPSDGGGGKKLSVDRVVISNVVANFILPVGIADQVSVKVPAIELQGVTSDNASGIVVAELIRRLIGAVLAAVAEQGKGILPADSLKMLRGDVEGLAGSLGDQAERFISSVQRDVAESVGKRARQIGEKIEKDVGKTLEGILPGRGKQDD